MGRVARHYKILDSKFKLQVKETVLFCQCCKSNRQCHKTTEKRKKAAECNFKENDRHLKGVIY